MNPYHDARGRFAAKAGALRSANRSVGLPTSSRAYFKAVSPTGMTTTPSGMRNGLTPRAHRGFIRALKAEHFADRAKGRAPLYSKKEIGRYASAKRGGRTYTAEPYRGSRR